MQTNSKIMLYKKKDEVQVTCLPFFDRAVTVKSQNQKLCTFNL